jgi:hypothetical protein
MAPVADSETETFVASAVPVTAKYAGKVNPPVGSMSVGAGFFHFEGPAIR